MKKSIYHLIKSFSNKKVLVIGDAMLDVYYCGSSERICREAPVPIVDVNKKREMPGGAANAAVNIARLGAKCTFISIIGGDENGRRLKKILRSEKIDISKIHEGAGRTISKERIMSGDQILLRYDFGNNKKWGQKLEAKIIQSLQKVVNDFDSILISDYGYGVLTSKVLNTLKKFEFKKPKVFAVDAKYPQRYKDFKATFVKPNFSEANKIIGKNGDIKSRIGYILKNRKKLINSFNSEIVAVTADVDGSLVLSQDTYFRTRTQPHENSKAAGAGDTYTAAFALALSSNASISEAAKVATAASSVVVEKEFTAYCTQNELLNALSPHKKLLEHTAISEILTSLRKQNKKIVFTNGCFDILHTGHIQYLSQAKELGDVLIVGVNTDSSIKRLKGQERPINSLFDRIQVLSALSSVDYIIPFGSNTPVELVKILKPDIYVKGGDYARESLPETPIVESYKGKVKILPYQRGYSTTKIIKRINHLGVA